MHWQEAKQTATETTEQAKGKAGELAQRAQETKESVKEKTGKTAEQAKGKAGELAQRAQETKESAKAKAAQAAQVKLSRRHALDDCSGFLLHDSPRAGICG